MEREKVHFGIEGTMVRQEFDTSALRIGGRLYVSREGASFAFSVQPKADFVPYSIVDISSSLDDGYRIVSLANRLIVPSNLADRILDATLLPREGSIGRMFRADVERALAAAALDVPLGKLHKDLFGDTRLMRIERVLDRLDLVAILNQKDVGMALWHHHRGLASYLLLTCFDVLGQRKEDPWIDFGEWLDSADAKSFDVGTTSSVEGARSLYEEYKTKYSVRRSFVRFVNEVLSLGARAELLDSVEIHRYPSFPRAGEAVERSDEKKVAWLFGIRNGYTHGARYVHGSHEELLPPDFLSSWWHMDEARTSENKTEFAIHNWPGALDWAVRQGIKAMIQRMAQR